MASAAVEGSELRVGGGRQPENESCHRCGKMGDTQCGSPEREPRALTLPMGVPLQMQRPVWVTPSGPPSAGFYDPAALFL